MTATREKYYLMRESVTCSSNASVPRAMRDTWQVCYRAFVTYMYKYILHVHMHAHVVLSLNFIQLAWQS